MYINCQDPYAETPSFDDMKNIICESEFLQSKFPGAQFTRKAYDELVQHHNLRLSTPRSAVLAKAAVELKLNQAEF